MDRALVARVQIHDVARRQEKMQNFGGHIFQVASSDFKVQTDDPSCQGLWKASFAHTPLGGFRFSSVVFDYKDRAMRMTMGDYGMRKPGLESGLQNRTLACVHMRRHTCGFGQ